MSENTLSFADLAALTADKKAALAANTAAAKQDFSDSLTATFAATPSHDAVVSLLQKGDHQLESHAQEHTLSRQLPYEPFNQVEEQHNLVWWQAQLRMAQTAIHAENPTALQRTALETTLKMIARLTEAESSKTVQEFEYSLLTEFGRRFLWELLTPDIETGQRKGWRKISQSIGKVFTGIGAAWNQTYSDLNQLRSQRDNLIQHARGALYILDDKPPLIAKNSALVSL